MRSDVVERADMRMIQVGNDMRFAFEALDGVGVRAHLVGQELDGHLAPEPRVFGLVHHSHAAGAETGQDLVMRNGLADHKDAVSGSSRRPRILVASCIGVKGFWRNGLPSSSTPVFTIASSM